MLGQQNEYRGKEYVASGGRVPARVMELGSLEIRWRRLAQDGANRRSLNTNVPHAFRGFKKAAASDGAHGNEITDQIKHFNKSKGREGGPARWTLRGVF